MAQKFSVGSQTKSNVRYASSATRDSNKQKEIRR